MDVRYQVFISSTFSDLQDERAKVQKTIMQLDCIPAGMELFPAIDEEQFEFIKRIIDDSDYYLLIIGGRYGSLANDGLSYTEKEYDYAISKGIKVIALIHSNPGSLSFDKSEQDTKSRKKLEAFRTKASTNRVVLFWKDGSELPAQVALSLPVTIKTYPAIGWVRANTVPNPDIYREYVDLVKENDRLKGLIGMSNEAALSDVAGLNDKVTINGHVVFHDFFGDDTSSQLWSVEVTWEDIFNLIASKLIVYVEDSDVCSTIGIKLHNKFGKPIEVEKDRSTSGISTRIDNRDFEKIRIQFRALDLISLSLQEGRLLWHLTPSGEKLLIINKAIRKES